MTWLLVIAMNAGIAVVPYQYPNKDACIQGGQQMVGYVRQDEAGRSMNVPLSGVAFVCVPAVTK